MQYLIGTDEAGYGPNLGPLVISATVWRVPSGTGGEDLYGRLGSVIVPTVQKAAETPAECVAMADSKVLYASGRGLRHLERGLWAAMALVDRRPRSWSEVWDALAPEAADDLKAIPWYASYERPAPLEVDPANLKPLARALRKGLAAAGVRLMELRSRAVFPRRFNELVCLHGSKGAALSHLTLDLVAHLIRPLGEAPISVVCDKHGGRNRYCRLLTQHFPDRLIEVCQESRQRSVYRFGPPARPAGHSEGHGNALPTAGKDRTMPFRGQGSTSKCPSGGRVGRVNRPPTGGPTAFCFQTQAETCLPAALASMASKYLRELAMGALNDFWGKRLPGLQPTAGYPRDAKRFSADIAGVLAQLNIDGRVLWRVK